MSGDARTVLDAGARAALESNKPLVYVCPPAAWAAAPLFAALPAAETTGPRLLVLAPEPGDVLDARRTLRQIAGFEPIHPATGIARAARLLAGGAVRTLIATPRSTLRLLELSQLKLDTVPVLALLWPELVLRGGDGGLLDIVLAEAPGAQRLIVTSDEGTTRELMERHARRAPLAVVSRPGEVPAGPARYVVVEEERRVGAVRGILDARNPAATLLWEPATDRFERWIEFAEDPTVTIADGTEIGQRFEMAVAADLPSAEVLARLAAAAEEVVVLIRSGQLPYLQRLARPLRSFRLSGPADRARERAHGLRQAVRERIEQSDVSAELLALDPLFDEYDPALVAAALARGAEAAPEQVGGAGAAVAWVRLRLNLGRRDHLRPADLVGALLNGVGLPKDHVGKVDIKESFSTVEVRAENAERAVQGLNSLTVRGRSVSARLGT